MKRWKCPTCADVVLAPKAPRSNDVRRYCLDCSRSTGKLVQRFCMTAAQRAHEKRVAEEAARQEAAAQRKAERKAAIRPAASETSPAGVYLDLIRTQPNSIVDIRELLEADDYALRRMVALAIKSMCAKSSRVDHVVKFQRDVARNTSGSWTPYGIRRNETSIIDGATWKYEHSYLCLFCNEDVHTVGYNGTLLDANIVKIIRHGCACAMEYLVELDQLAIPKPATEEAAS